MEINQIALQVLFIFLPADLIDAHGRFPLEAVEAPSEQIDADMVQQGRELKFAVLAGRVAHAVQSA